MMYNVIPGPGLHSPNVTPSPHYPQTYKPITNVKIAYLGGMGTTKPSKDVVKAMSDAIKVLQAQGAIVDKIEFDFEFEESLSEAFSQIALSLRNHRKVDTATSSFRLEKL